MHQSGRLLTFGSKARLTVGVPVHIKGVGWGWGQTDKPFNTKLGKSFHYGPGLKQGHRHVDTGKRQKQSVATKLEIVPKIRFSVTWAKGAHRGQTGLSTYFWPCCVCRVKVMMWIPSWRTEVLILTQNRITLNIKASSLKNPVQQLGFSSRGRPALSAKSKINTCMNNSWRQKQEASDMHFKTNSSSSSVTCEDILPGNVSENMQNRCTAGEFEPALFWALCMKSGSGLPLVYVELRHLTFPCSSGAAQCPTTKHCTCSEQLPGVSPRDCMNAKQLGAGTENHDACLAETPREPLSTLTVVTAGHIFTFKQSLRHQSLTSPCGSWGNRLLSKVSTRQNRSVAARWTYASLSPPYTHIRGNASHLKYGMFMSICLSS